MRIKTLCLQLVKVKRKIWQKQMGFGDPFEMSMFVQVKARLIRGLKRTVYVSRSVMSMSHPIN